ncbi:Uncharacterised protein [Bordetella pertussis]|nr:Uncharacterised protein [Bordetella pertussis]CFP67091.1 Uncharacterised protein [Bordetella pertussis]CFU07491.1 Uncharacterised protein [Bordetella pertussis]CFW32319.1 Uncharacterised protein [Bordetella pertussis]CPO82076.1 Uncharacterised protein [Bordetella pertussis]
MLDDSGRISSVMMFCVPAAALPTISGYLRLPAEFEPRTTPCTPSWRAWRVMMAEGLG